MSQKIDMHLDMHSIEAVVETAKEVLEEKELIESGHHKKIERVILLLRNLAVFASVGLSISSLSTSPFATKFRAIGYFCGMFAYLCELALLTDCFSKRISQSEGFMAYCFGPLYFIMGISYLLH